MSDQHFTAASRAENRDELPGTPAPSAAELAEAVLNAAETVARLSATALPATGTSDSESADVARDSERETAAAALLVNSERADVDTVDSDDPSRNAAEQKEKPEKKKPGLGPRWSYVITRGLVVALVWAFFAFAFDPLIRFGTVQSAQAVAGAKVDVEHFSTEFFPPRLHVRNAAVANRNEPGTNLFEFESIEGEVDGLALMKKSYILNKATVAGLRWGTERSDSGLLDGEETETTEEDDKKSELLNRLKEAGREWARELLGRASMNYDPKNLETYVLADQLEDEWKTDFDDLESRVDDVEAGAKQLKQSFDAARKDPLRNLTKLDQIVKDGLRLKEQLKQIRADVGRLPPKAQEDLNELNESRRRDAERIQREIKDLVLNEDNLSEFLLGPELHYRITQAISWLKWTDERVVRFGAATPKHTRGEVIAFTDRNPLPEFLARLISVSGEGEIAGDQLTIRGTLSDVTNDPMLHGKPTIVRLEGHGDARVKLHATIDRTRDVPSNELSFSYESSRPTDETLGDDDSLSVVVHAGSTEWTANLRTLDEELNGTIVFRQKPVRLEAKLKEGTDERLRQIVESSVAAVDEVQATVTISGTFRDPEWKLRTTLGRQILRGVERGVNEALSAQKEAFIAKLDGELKVRQQEFLDKLNGRYGAIAEQLKLNDMLLSELNANELIQRVSGGRFDPRKILR